jgi:hypothetical protein
VRLLSGLLVLVALALMVSALGVGAGGWPWDDEPAVADGYPQRIERPYVVRELPAKPGPLAGLLRDGSSWFAVSPSGRLWNLADDDDRFEVQPALSDDGRVLAYLRKSDNGVGEYVIRDLVSGELTAFPDVSSGSGDSDATFFVSGQQPAYVSPSGDAVLVRGGRLDERRNDDGLLIDSDGVHELFVKGVGWPAGWAPDGRLAWLITPSFPIHTRTPDVLATTVTGKEVGRRRLTLSRPMSFDQWTARLSPYGDFLSLVSPDSGHSTLVRVSLADGQEVGRDSVPELNICQPSWRGDQALLPTDDDALAEPSGAGVVVADPSLAVDCSIWATRALAGNEHHGVTGTVFGTSTSWLSWRWREVTAGLLLIFAAFAFWWAGRQRRSATEPAEAAEPPMVSV